MESPEFWLKEAREAREAAAHEYQEAITYAVEQNWSNVRIAKVLGISEAAIRQYRKRRGIK